MSARDRTITLVLVAAAIAAWFAVATVFAFVSPVADAGAQLLGALTLGTAVGLTLWPLLWTASRHHAGSFGASARRSALAGLVVSILVVLRAIDVVTLPVTVFILLGAVLVEVAFMLHR